VDGPDAAPCPVQVLQDQTPVAMLGPGLAAQQYRGSVKEVPVQRLLYPALPQKFEEYPLVVRPYPALPVRVEDLAGWGEPWFVKVLGAAQFLKEERKVGATGEPGEPGRVVQPHVEESPDADVLQSPEELGRRLLREADRIDFRGLASVSGNRAGWPPSVSPSI
jgi:hypothetical protein